MTDFNDAPLALSMGEPAGIGPDLILQLFARRHAEQLPPFLVYGNADFLRSRAQRLGLSLQITQQTPQTAGLAFESSLPVADIDGMVVDRPGQPNTASGKVVIEAIARGVRDTLAGETRAIVTAPIHKAALYSAGFAHPGHTEFLAALCAGNGPAITPVMMLTNETLRVVPATIHIPISAVPNTLSIDLLLSVGRTVVSSLRHRFGIDSPRIAFCGLNPHASEAGAIGMEDLEIVGPAVAQLQEEGLDVSGPVPADTLFHLPHWRRYDAVVAMYHDQALIPIKTVAFDEAVNVTLGLPIVRTSPDHGTAFDLAATGKASPTSMLAAIRLADRMTRPPA
ncbi:4-hydroxythreonine-4-phosphate dehydrogenase PdxA [Devosia sp.]|uniref:4-hydroxythreonine-4-phosphate dehydrogenase PdxA n=1 Tax=Devosia sp. TaxID=1871048 RepID=UPI003A8E7D67